MTTSFETRISHLHLTGGVNRETSRILSDTPLSIQVPANTPQAFSINNTSQTQPLFSIDSVHNTIQINAPTYINQPMFVRYLEEIDTLDHMPVFSGLEMGGWAVHRDPEQIVTHDNPIAMTAKLDQALAVGILTSGTIQINQLTLPNTRLLQ
jgi:hypothetical protein